MIPSAEDSLMFPWAKFRIVGIPAFGKMASNSVNILKIFSKKVKDTIKEVRDQRGGDITLQKHSNCCHDGSKMTDHDELSEIQMSIGLRSAVPSLVPSSVP